MFLWRLEQSSWTVSPNYGKRCLIDKRASGQPARDGGSPAEAAEAPGFAISQGSRWFNARSDVRAGEPRGGGAGEPVCSCPTMEKKLIKGIGCLWVCASDLAPV